MNGLPSDATQIAHAKQRLHRWRHHPAYAAWWARILEAKPWNREGQVELAEAELERTARAAAPSLVPPPETVGDEAWSYDKPEHGWTCFHCGETFTETNRARDHFGHSIAALPACQVPAEHVAAELRRFRVVEEELRDVLSRLYTFREMLDATPPNVHDADLLYRLCQRAVEAIDGPQAPASPPSPSAS